MEIILPKIEKEVLESWKKNRIFEKTLEKNKGKERFVFYEGPPFANGLPGIHHLLARAFKDVMVRYKTMRGFLVDRKAGWDTHGLPTEMAAEKKLGIKSKKEIEKDIPKFITECRNSVFTYKKEWEEFTERIGYWLDMENAYMTCSNEYVESLWWILKQIWDKGLLLKDYKAVPYCPRCGTSLSSHEVAQGYRTVSENSIYVKFPLKGEKSSYLLVWTTTPWTLPGNVAIALNKDLAYVKAKNNKGEILIVAKERIKALSRDCEVIGEVSGKDLLGLEYEPVFAFHKPDKKAWFIVSGDFVSTEDGTGLVHIAPAFGEDDMDVGKKNDLPLILNVDEEGKFKDEVTPWAGIFVKDADKMIIEDLKKRDLLFKEETYSHEYPFCWRCESPLLYYAKESWFIKTTVIKEKLIENNKKINWFPSYLKEGRFGEWLNDLKDWNLSRERYWGTPLPVWECQKCKKTVCIGSLEELKEKAVGKPLINDLHRPLIDEIVLKCDCGGEMKRVKAVIDCWFDSGSMPFAQWHYPFENKELIDEKKFFPADFICEGIDQTRGWFYTLLVISTLLDKEPPFKNVVSVGIVLDAKSQKMSKSKGNIVSPLDIADSLGVDTARFYFYTINPVAEPKRFDLKDVQSLYRTFFDTLFNAKNFFETYVDKKEFKAKDDFQPDNLLDKWILSFLERLNIKVVEKLEVYDIVGAARLFEDFVDDLSNWHIRRSRKRFQKPDSQKEKEEASQTLHYVLLKLSLLLAPFTPFLSESFYKDLGGKEESVHLENYPVPKKEWIDDKLEEKMARIKKIVALVLAERALLKIKVRQPLGLLKIKDENIGKELLGLIKEEVNVKEISFDKNIEKEIELSKEITSELKEEGIMRELIHHVQDMRKKARLKPEDKVKAFYSGDSGLCDVLKRNKKEMMEELRLEDLSEEKKDGLDSEEETEVDGQKLWLGIKKV